MLAWGYSSDGYEHVTEIEGDRSRWRQGVTVVVRRTSDGKLFGVDFQRGLTENCDHSYPWDGDDEAEFEEMQEVQVTKTVYQYREA